MRNFRALVVCTLGVLLVSSALVAADGEGSSIEARLAALEQKDRMNSNAKATMGEKLPFVIDGFIDVTGNYNFNRSPSRVSLGRSYDAAADTFTLNVAHVALHKEAQKGSVIGFNVEIDMGEDARVNNGAKKKANGSISATSDLFDVQEAWVKILVPQHENCGVQAGKFATWEGIEVMESTRNPVISRGFLFVYGEPTTHVGVNTFYTHDMGNGMTFDIKIGAVNGWDLEADNNTDKTFIWYLGVAKADVFEAHFNGTWGDEQTATTTNTGHKAGNPRTSLDLTGHVQTPDGMVVVYFQVNSGQEKEARANAKWVHWFGCALEPVVDLKNQLPGAKLGARFEMFDDTDGQRINAFGTNEPQTVFNVTICPSYAISSDCTVRFEYRYDWSNLNRGQNARAFEDSKGASDLNHQSTAMVELLYTFTTEPAN